VGVVASLSQGRTAAAQCGLFTYKSVPVIFEPPCMFLHMAGSLAMVYVKSSFILCLIFNFAVTGQKIYIIFLYTPPSPAI